MTRTGSHVFVAALIITAGAVAGVGTAVTWGQESRTSPTQADVLPALLVEVRGLRAAMEQMAAAGPRVQLALGRLQIQEQRVSTLVRRLDDMKTSRSAAEKSVEQMEQQIKTYEEMAREASDANERKASEEGMKMFKVQLAQLRAELQHMQSEEAAVTQELAAEQSRWNDFNQRLEELERALGREK
jgi:predicted  nucleic acid-binding Zn-ribbon protein